MTLICKKCGAPIAVKNINMQTMVAGCEVCNAVFTFSIDDLSTTLKGKKLEEHALTGLMLAQNTADTFDITLYWRKMLGSLEWTVIFLMGIGALFLTPFAFILWHSFFNASSGLISIALLATCMSLIAFVCWYILAVFAVDDTRFTLTEDELRYTHGPIPWQPKHFSRESIAAVELKPVENFENYRELVVITTDGKRHILDHFQIHYAQHLHRKLQLALFPPADMVENPFALVDSDIEGDSDDAALDNAALDNAVLDNAMLDNAALDDQTRHELRIGDDGEWDIRRANTKSNR